MNRQTEVLTHGCDKAFNSDKNNEISIEQAEAELKNLPYEDLGFAKLDHHRKVRQGFEEVVYCQGKATPHLVKIYQTLTAEGIDVLGHPGQPGAV